MVNKFQLEGRFSLKAGNFHMANEQIGQSDLSLKA